MGENFVFSNIERTRPVFDRFGLCSESIRTSHETRKVCSSRGKMTKADRHGFLGHLGHLGNVTTLYVRQNLISAFKNLGLQGTSDIR